MVLLRTICMLGHKVFPVLRMPSPWAWWCQSCWRMSMQSLYSLALAPQGDLQTCLRPLGMEYCRLLMVLIGTGNVELLYLWLPSTSIPTCWWTPHSHHRPPLCWGIGHCYGRRSPVVVVVPLAIELMAPVIKEPFTSCIVFENRYPAPITFLA